eukprot:COSAG01_NODE_25213_length_752_cov_0.944870_1_plen_67_part_01
MISRKKAKLLEQAAVAAGGAPSPEEAGRKKAKGVGVAKRKQAQTLLLTFPAKSAAGSTEASTKKRKG